MGCPRNSLQSVHQPAPDVGVGLEAPLNARLPHTTRAALTRLRRVGYAVEKLPRQSNGAGAVIGSRANRRSRRHDGQHGRPCRA
jgi:hypothetical protein